MHRDLGVYLPAMGQQLAILDHLYEEYNLESDEVVWRREEPVVFRFRSGLQQRAAAARCYRGHRVYKKSAVVSCDTSRCFQGLLKTFASFEEGLLKVRI